MAIFPVLDYEEKVQLGDKTRFNAEKCFLAPASTTAIATVTIKPGLGGSDLSVYDATAQENWYLDWIFNTWDFDVVAGINDKIDFEQGGVKSATVTPGTYSLADLLTEIATQLNATSGISGTFSVSSDEKNRITVSNDTAGFQLLGFTGINRGAGLLPHIGFAKDSDGGSSTLGAPVEYSMKKVVLTINNAGDAQVLTKYVKLYSVAGDCLFSNDQDLITWEPDIMKWVPKGRSSFLNIAREAQEQILYWLDQQGYVNVYQQKYTKFDIVDLSEVNEWSAFSALAIIMWGISNKTDDVFLKRHFEYRNKAQDARNRAVLRLDVDGDGVVDIGEHVSISSGTIVTR